MLIPYPICGGMLTSTFYDLFLNSHFFMLMLVTADNFLQLFFGWEAVGLASYLLIYFWFTRLQASKASIKAMLINRIGDFWLALGVICFFSHVKGVRNAPLFSCVPQKAEDP